MNIKKKTNILKKSLCLLLTLAFVLSAGALNSFAEETVNTEETSEYVNLSYEEYASSKAGKLFVNTESGRFYYEDKAGTRWYSNPDKGDLDSKASGIYRMELQSVLFISYFDIAAEQYARINSEAHCARQGNVEIKKTSNGFTAIYKFQMQGFSIPVTVELTDTGLKAYIDCKKIEENSKDKYLIMKIALLPYFGSGEPDEQGYIMVADGSGCIMNFNNRRYTKLGYSSPIYGADISKYIVAKGSNSYPITMPVYGIKKEKSALTAIVEDGAALGTVTAYPNGAITSYSNVYTSFEIRLTDMIYINEDAPSAKSAEFRDTGDMKVDKISVKYVSLIGEDADYNGMARAYKNYLIKRDGLKLNNQEISKTALDFAGAVKKKKSVLGFPITVNTAVSEIEEITDFIDRLYDDGIQNISVTLRDWSREQLSAKIDNSLKPVGCFGSKKELKELSDLLKKENGKLYLNVNINKFAKSGKGYNKWFHSARALSNSPIFSYSFFVSNYEKNKKATRYSLLIPSSIEKLAGKIIAGSEKYDGAELSFGNITTGLYSSFNEDKEYNSEGTRQIFARVLNKANKSALDFPADYALKNTSLAQKVPTSSTKNDIFDKDIPFVQLVLSGLVPYTAEAVNLSADMDKAVLEAIAVGSGLQFDLITNDADSVIGTAKNDLFYSNAELLEDSIKRYSDITHQLSELLGNGYMVSYSEENGKSVAVYSNGASVTADRNDLSIKARDKDGKTLNFAIKEDKQ